MNVQDAQGLERSHLVGRRLPFEGRANAVSVEIAFGAKRNEQGVRAAQ